MISQDAPRPLGQSLTLRGAAAMAVAFMLARIGVDVAGAPAQAIIQSVTDLLFTLGAMAVGVGRARAHAPLR